MPLLTDDISGSSAWQEMWQNPEADATVLNAMMLSKYGEESLDWDPVTIQMEIKEDFGVTPASEVMDRICAMQIVMLTDGFFKRVDAFRNIVNAIACGQPFFQTFTPLQTEEIAIAVATVGMNRDMLSFAPAVQELVRISMRGDGYGDGDCPRVLSCVFDGSQSERSVRRHIRDIMSMSDTDLPTAADNNATNIDSMLRVRMLICLNQLDSLPGLTMLDGTIMEKGIVRALEDASGGDAR